MKTSATSVRELSLDQLESRLLLDASSAFVDAEAFVAAAVTSPSTLYVSVNGDDDNTGASPDTAFRTIGEAVRNTVPGTTVYVLPGVYREHVLNMPGGTSDSFVRLAAFDPTDRPVIRPNPGDSRAMSFASAASSYIEVDGFVMDAIDAVHDAVKITGGSAETSSHHIRIKNSEIMNSRNQGLLVNGPGAVHNEFVNLDIHDNGIDRFDHGVYISSPHNLVEHSTIHNNSGWGIHNYGGNPSHNTYKHNTITNNNRAGEDAPGIGIYTGSEILVFGNTVSGNYTGIDVRATVSSIVVSNNTVFENDLAGVVVGPPAGSIELADNHVFDNPYDVRFNFPSLDSEDIEFAMVDAFSAIDGTENHCTYDCSVAGSPANGQQTRRSEPVGQPTIDVALLGPATQTVGDRVPLGGTDETKAADGNDGKRPNTSRERSADPVVTPSQRHSKPVGLVLPTDVDALVDDLDYLLSSYFAVQQPNDDSLDDLFAQLGAE